ncbi:hypothetical protein DK846_06620 [Methanospirillum lacunae]|uniref:Uncharacterized protein n=2 Tax=Methanospirillum lacunae TaxID=668570 RepID=A0A2V2MWU8_9EURY|nr:hypothetical protein DK846_06620 [Methanospirillum lacunae]
MLLIITWNESSISFPSLFLLSAMIRTNSTSHNTAGLPPTYEFSIETHGSKTLLRTTTWNNRFTCSTIIITE